MLDAEENGGSVVETDGEEWRVGRGMHMGKGPRDRGACRQQQLGTAVRPLSCGCGRADVLRLADLAY